MPISMADGLVLPDEAVTQTFAIVAKRGMGKTNTATVMVEEMVKNHLPVIAIDPIGVWWGLRFSADGKKPGLPVTILGGEHADLPLDAGMGESVADFVAENRSPMVIDLGLFSGGEQRRFMTDFAERLYLKNRNPLHLVLDEADAWAPQNPEKGGEPLLGAINKIVRRGRARGLGVTLISQRPAIINKNVLTQIEVLITMRMTSPQDRRAIEDWIDYHADKKQAEEVLTSLSSLPVGTAWIWSPGWLDMFQKVSMHHRVTFDSSKTPEVGKHLLAPTNAAKIDFEVLKKKFSSTIEKSKAENPKFLLEKIKELEALIISQEGQHQVELEAAQATPEPIPPPVVHVPIVTDEVVTVLRSAVSDLKDVVGSMHVTVEQMMNWVQQMDDSRDPPVKTAPDRPMRPIKDILQSKSYVAQIIPPIAPRRNAQRGYGHQGEQMPSGERKILVALAQHGIMNKSRLGILSGYASKGGGFNNYLSSLRGKGLIHGHGDMDITDKGLKALGRYEPLPQGKALLDWWANELGTNSAPGKSLLALRKFFPKAVRKEAIAKEAGYESNGGGFNNGLSKLRTLGLLEGRGEMRLNPNLVG